MVGSADRSYPTPKAVRTSLYQNLSHKSPTVRLLALKHNFRVACHPEMIDAGFDEVFAKKLNVKLKLQDSLVPVFFVADFPTKRMMWTFLEDILHNR